jgi:hypothetical protein
MDTDEHGWDGMINGGGSTWMRGVMRAILGENTEMEGTEMPGIEGGVA